MTRLGVLLILLLATVESVAAQSTSWSAHIAMTAIKSSAITLSVEEVPLSFVVEGALANTMTVPVTAKWDVNPTEVRGFDIIGYFADPSAALRMNDTNVPAAAMQASYSGTPFQSFTNANLHTLRDNALVLAGERTMRGNHQGQRHDTLALRIDPLWQQSIPDGEYRGMLYLEVRHY